MRSPNCSDCMARAGCLNPTPDSLSETAVPVQGGRRFLSTLHPCHDFCDFVSQVSAVKAGRLLFVDAAGPFPYICQQYLHGLQCPVFLPFDNRQTEILFSPYSRRRVFFFSSGRIRRTPLALLFRSSELAS